MTYCSSCGQHYETVKYGRECPYCHSGETWLVQGNECVIKEIEAESIACVVCTFLGLDTQNFNFSYITGWADGDIDKFRENIDVISRHARTLIKGIQKEMVVEANKEKESGEVKAEGPATPPLQIPMPMIPEAKNQEIEMA